jgi:hypothetical protein
MLSQQDEQWWKDRENFDRDAYWAVRVGDKAMYLPKPFELGALGTLAERTWELAFNHDMTLRKWGANFGQTLLNTFSLDPTPQIVKPALAVYANKDPSTQRPIESGLDQTLRPQDRYDENTSGVARVLGELGLPNPVSLAQSSYSPLSPKQIDYMLRAYFGTMATFTTAAIDGATRPLSGRGAVPSFKDDTLSAGFVRDLPSNHSRFVEDLYSQAQQVREAYASVRAAQQRGDWKGAQAIEQEERPALQTRGAVEGAEKQMAAVGRQIRQVEASTFLSSDTKRKMLDQLNQQRNAIARATMTPLE